MNEDIQNLIKSYSIEDLKDLIDSAEQEIEQKKAGEIEQIRAQWMRMAEVVEMTPEEVLSYSTRKKRSSGKPKYRNPDDGRTWTGFGKKPGWLKDYLDQGRDIEEFRIPE